MTSGTVKLWDRIMELSDMKNKKILAAVDSALHSIIIFYLEWKENTAKNIKK